MLFPRSNCSNCISSRNLSPLFGFSPCSTTSHRLTGVQSGCTTSGTFTLTKGRLALSAAVSRPVTILFSMAGRKQEWSSNDNAA